MATDTKCHTTNYGINQWQLPPHLYSGIRFRATQFDKLSIAAYFAATTPMAVERGGQSMALLYVRHVAHAGGGVGRLRSFWLLFISSCFYQRMHYDTIAASASTKIRRDQTGVNDIGPTVLSVPLPYLLSLTIYSLLSLSTSVPFNGLKSGADGPTRYTQVPWP